MLLRRMALDEDRGQHLPEQAAQLWREAELIEGPRTKSAARRSAGMALIAGRRFPHPKPGRAAPTRRRRTFPGFWMPIAHPARVPLRPSRQGRVLQVRTRKK